MTYEVKSVNILGSDMDCLVFTPESAGPFPGVVVAQQQDSPVEPDTVSDGPRNLEIDPNTQLDKTLAALGSCECESFW